MSLERKLNKNRVYLTKKLEVNEELLSHFIQKKILTDSSAETILSKPTTMSQASEFIKMVSKRGDRCLPVLMNALAETGQDEVGELIDKDAYAQYSNASETVSVSPEDNQERIDQLMNKKFHEDHLDLRAKKSCLTDRNKQDIKDGRIFDTLGEKKGLTVIFNNVNYKHLTFREGSDKDRTHVVEMFESMGYKIYEKENLDSESFEKELKALKDLIEQKDSDYKSLVFFLLGHGNEKGLCLTDYDPRNPLEKTVYSYNKLLEQFDWDHCFAFRGKPKLFFIQACQGKNETYILNGLDDFQNIKDKPKPSLRRDDDGNSVADATSEPITHPKADFYVACATVPGYVSYRMPAYGSWFIRTLIIVLSVMAHTSNIDAISTAVRSAISSRKARDNDKDLEKLQQPEARTTLNKPFYFFPSN